MRRAALLAAILLVVGREGAAGAGETPLHDKSNPRNARWVGQVIEHVVGTPRMRAAGLANRGAWPAGTAVEWRIARRLQYPAVTGSQATSSFDAQAMDGAEWSIDGVAARPEGGFMKFKMSNGVVAVGGTEPFVRWTGQAGRHLVAVKTPDDSCEVATDSLRVRLLVEKATFDDGQQRFGSFVRRFRKSLDDLNALMAASVSPHASMGIVDRFRIGDALVYRAADGPASAGWQHHPEAEVAIACDADGSFGGAFRGEPAVGFVGAGRKEGRDLWTATAEQTMWRDLLRLRGVPDYARYAAAKHALPGRADRGLGLPKRFAVDLVASPDQTAQLTELTALLVNSNTGLSIIGDPDDPKDATFGRTWTWIPPRIDLQLVDGGAPAAGAVVRWWRSLSIKGLPAEMPQGVAAGRAPDGEATAGEDGAVTITGDVLAKNAPDGLRSLWLLVEVERAGAKRFEIVYGLDLNLAWARGQKDAAALRWDLASMLVPGGAVPADR